MLVDKKSVENVIQRALEKGADFCDLFAEKCDSQVISFNESKVKNIESGIDFGIGIRLIYGTQALYGYTNSKEEKDLIELVDKLAAQYNFSKTIMKPLSFKEIPYKKIQAFNDKEVGLKERIEILAKLDKLARERSQFIHQVNLMMLQKKQMVEIYDSEGLMMKETRPYVRLVSSALAKDGDKRSSAGWNPGSRGGFEFFEGLDLNKISEHISDKAMVTLNAKPCPAGQMPVVIDNGFGGVIFHEACGHLLETTSVEKKASVFWDKKNELIAHENLSAVDDGTIDNLWGSISIDDEGMPTQKTVLIKNGRLENFLSDRLGELKTGHKRTGSARRQSYRFAPASRMRNTFIDKGTHSLDDLLQSMGDGLYAKSMGGGSVNPGTGEFNFAVEEGYLVKNGKITEAVKGATLIGRGEDIMKRISMVSNDLEFSAGMCGSVSGSVPVTVGQPAVKVDEILVGGQA